MAPIHVLVADDHPIVRSGIRSLLERQPDIVVVGEATDGVQTLEMVHELQPDVLLLDMEMPGINGVDVARRLQDTGSRVRVLGLSAYDDRHYILNMLYCGAAGYLTKEEAPQLIVDAVRGVFRGEKGWLSRSVAARVMNWMQQDEEPQTPELSERELDVLRLVAAGGTNQSIGAALGISEKTVEKHLEAVFAKLHVTSRVEAAVRAVREGLV
jgi:DNA-binding NarL/FixJ family response regulator